MKTKEKVSVLIPSHNEEKTIKKLLSSLISQSLPPSEIIVACDNCTDSTFEKVENFSINNSTKIKIKIFKTINNKSKKAGALNQALNSLELNNYILIMDADTILDSNAIEKGIKVLSSDKKIGAVCSSAGVSKYEGKNLWEKVLWSLQHIEYGQFDSQRIETNGKIKVAHGMATIFKKEALISIPNIRSKFIPKENKKNIYLENNLVEDYEATLCLKHKWMVSTALDMLAFTDVPLSTKELFNQRLRWLRGGVDTLRLHSFNKVTIFEILNHFLFVFLISIRILLIGMAVYSLFNFKSYKFNYLILGIIILSLLESCYRMKYIKNICFFDYVIKLMIIPEAIYAWFQATILIYSYFLSFFNIKQRW